MNIQTLRRKTVVIPTIATLAVLGAGATVWSATANDDVNGADRDRISAAAVDAAGGGTVVEVEKSDDAGEAYEVEVRMDDGTEVDVALDQDLKVVSESRDDDADDSGDSDGSRDTETDDRALSEQERTAAEAAAAEAVQGGTVEQVEASDDPGAAYEVDVRAEDGTEWDVTLDADFKVLSKTADD